MSYLEEAVKIHLLKVMILRDNTADKTNKLIRILNVEIGNIDQANLIIEFEHVLGALIQIADITQNTLYFGIDFLQKELSFTLTFVADD